MRRKVINYIFFSLLSIISLLVSYGLTLLQEGDNYFYGLELSTIFFLFVLVLFMSEELKGTNKNDYKTVKLYKVFYKDIITFIAVLLIGGIAVFIFVKDITFTNVSYLILPIVLIISSIDFVADTYVYMYKQNSDSLNKSFKTLISLVFYPFIYISVVSLLGVFTKIGIWWLIVIAITIKVLFKSGVILLIKKLPSEQRT